MSGCTDHFSGTEEEAFHTSRDIVSTFNIDVMPSPEHYAEPLYDVEELAGIIPAQQQHTMDAYQVLRELDLYLPTQCAHVVYVTSLNDVWCVVQVIARIVDGSGLQEFKQKYGVTLVTGFARIHG